MEHLRLTVVGQDIFKIVQEKCEEVGLNPVNQVKTGMLGNLKILSFTFELEENDVLQTRKILMQNLLDSGGLLMPMYVHGDWLRIFVFKTIRI